MEERQMKQKKIMLLVLIGLMPFLLAFRFGGEIRYGDPVKFQVNSDGYTGFRDIAVGDVDGDGDQDIIAIYNWSSTAYKRNEVRVYLNQNHELGGPDPTPLGGTPSGTVKDIDTLFSNSDENGTGSMYKIYQDGWRGTQGTIIPTQYYGPYLGRTSADSPSGMPPGDTNNDYRSYFSKLAVAYKTVGGKRVVDYIVVARSYGPQGVTWYSSFAYTPRHYAGRLIQLKNPYDGSNSDAVKGAWLSKEVGSSRNAVMYFNGTTYTDNSAEARTPAGAPFTVLAGTTNYLYVGDSAKFTRIYFGFSTLGSGMNLTLEYYNGSTLSWTPISTITDHTNNLSVNGGISLPPSIDGKSAPNLPNWAQTAVNGTTKYWIRLTTSSGPGTNPQAYFVATEHRGHMNQFDPNYPAGSPTTADADATKPQFYLDDYTWLASVGDDSAKSTFSAIELADLNNDGDYDLFAAPRQYHNADQSGDNVQYAKASIYRYDNDGTNNFNNDYNDSKPGDNFLWSDGSTNGTYNQFSDFHLVDIDKDGIPDLLGLQGGGSSAPLSWIQGKTSSGGSFSNTNCKSAQLNTGGTMADIWAGNLRAPTSGATGDNNKGYPDLVCSRAAEAKIEASMYSNTKGTTPSTATYSDWQAIYTAPSEELTDVGNTWMYNIKFGRVMTADVDNCGENEIIVTVSGRTAQYWIFKKQTTRYLTMMNLDEPR
jgi:hypothetical protein